MSAYQFYWIMHALLLISDAVVYGRHNHGDYARRRQEIAEELEKYYARN